jgi:hypothetical protein
MEKNGKKVKIKNVWHECPKSLGDNQKGYGSTKCKIN